MIADDLLTLLKSDPRNATEISDASGVHPVTIRKLRLETNAMSGTTIATAEKLAAAFGKLLSLENVKKSKKQH